MKKDVRQLLSDCPTCELNKARQNTAHGLFCAQTICAPRAQWPMDFQGQGTALTGETEALALIDPTSRYVVVIPLPNREAKTWLQPFLDRIVFTFGAPTTLHSDAAPEFLSEALALLAQAANIQTTTTLGTTQEGMARSRYSGGIETAACGSFPMTIMQSGLHSRAASRSPTTPPRTTALEG
jgi:hypothetical protein